MTDREKLLKLINSMVTMAIVTDGVMRYAYEPEKLVDQLIAHGVTVQEWISVGDRLPESEDVVLIAYKGRNYVGTGYFYEGFCEWDSPAGQKIVPPDYWMPLPEAPKEGQKCAK